MDLVGEQKSSIDIACLRLERRSPGSVRDARDVSGYKILNGFPASHDDVCAKSQQCATAVLEEHLLHACAAHVEEFSAGSQLIYKVFSLVFSQNKA